MMLDPSALAPSAKSSSDRPSSPDGTARVDVVEVDAPTVVRPLAKAESFLLDAARREPANIVVGARVSGGLDETTLRRALDIVQREEPMLDVRVSNDRGTFVRGGVPIPLKTIHASDPQAGRLVDAELRRPFDPRRPPLVRVAFAKGEPSQLVIASHHVMSDGKSLLYLMHRVLAVAGALAAGAPPPAREAAPTQSIDALLPDNTRGLRKSLKLLPMAAKTVRSLCTHHLRPRAYGKDADLQPQHQSWRTGLDVEQTRRLVAACRREGTTVHGAVTAAMLLATRSVVEEEGGGSRGVIALGSAVDVRSRLRETVPPGVGMYAAAATTEHRVTEKTDFWKLAREVKADLTRTIDSGEPLIAPQLYRPGSDLTETRLAQRLDPAVFVTNLGRYPYPMQSGQYRIDDISLAASAATTGSLIAAVLTANDRLSIRFSHQEMLLASSVARRIANSAIERLRSIE